MRLILLGPPGSGKGTQAKLLRDKFNIPHISTGVILRENISTGTELGILANKFMDKGELVPDEVILKIVASILDGEEDNSRFIFDGFPRTIPQSEGFDKILSDRNLALNHVINIEVLEDEVVNRLSSRWSCPNCGSIYNTISNPPAVAGICDVCGHELQQRDDDKPETVRNRLAIYFEQTEPLIDYYRDKALLRTVSGDGGPKSVFDRILGEFSKSDN